LLDVIGSSVTDILMLAYRGLTMVYGCYVRGRRILVTSNVIVIATSPVTVWLARRLRYCSSRRREFIVSSWTRESSRASNIQCSANFSYALFTNGSLACAARCLASSAFRRQVSISDDIGGGSSNAPNQAASAAALVSWSLHPRPYPCQSSGRKETCHVLN
jgi:hypothetical protein